MNGIGKKLKKHGISFEDAKTVFDDPLYVDFYDPDHSDDEHRYLIIGRSYKGHLMIVSYTEQDDKLRLISARKPHRRSGKLMRTADTEMNDDLRDEYDLTRLRVRKLGPGRKSFNGINVHLEPDVAELFPDSRSVNEALRFLIRVTRQKAAA